MRVMRNEPDAGVNLSFRIKNVGKSGVIKITPRLSTSEGEWTREQTLKFDAGESKHLTYFFHEPTINAENIECYVRASP